MGRASTIHALGDRRPDFDAALLRGEPSESIRKRFGISKDAISRYRNGEFAKKVQTQTALQHHRATNTANPYAPPPFEINAAEELGKLYQQGQALLAKAEDTGQLATAVGALGKLTKVLEVHSKLLGDINTGTVVNHTEITIESVSTHVRQVALNFQDAPREVREWAAKTMLTGAK